MKSKKICKPILSILTAVSLFLGVLPLSAAAGTAPKLSIQTVQIAAEDIPDSREVAVDVTIADNSDGFLATSFGISYDSALKLDRVESAETTEALAHTSSINPDRRLVWFTGASTGAAAENRDTAEQLFTLYFILPQEVQDEQSFPISFCWTKANGKQGFWYTADRSNDFGGLQAQAVNGGISIGVPDTTVALNETELTLAVDETAELSVSNADKVIWFSGDPSVAAVENGKVTAKAVGECVIYAIVDNKTYECTVNVLSERPYDITQTDTIYLRDPAKNAVLTCPEAEGEIRWFSNHPDIAKVENGVVTGISNGTTQVYAIFDSQAFEVQVVVEFAEAPQGTGDVNQDDNVNILDVLALNRNLLIGEHLNSIQQLAADVNIDNRLDAVDALNILKHVIGQITVLPIRS